MILLQSHASNIEQYLKARINNSLNYLAVIGRQVIDIVFWPDLHFGGVNRV
mgnify:CR=1 FL=1